MVELIKLFFWVVFTLVRVLIGLGLVSLNGYMLYFTIRFELVPPIPIWFFFLGIWLGCSVMMIEFFPSRMPSTRRMPG